MTHPVSGREPDGSADQDRRVALILARARRELAARDVVTFVAARAWSAVLALGSLFGAVFGTSGSDRRHEPPPRASRPPTIEE